MSVCVTIRTKNILKLDGITMNVIKSYPIRLLFLVNSKSAIGNDYSCICGKVWRYLRSIYKSVGFI